MTSAIDCIRAVRIPLLLAATLAAGGAGCARHLSHGLTPEGKISEAMFPAPSDAILKDGTFPTVDNVRAIGPGISKDQLYALVGRPHFHAGFKAREWDYLFNFRTGDDAARACQYKVVFDKAGRGQTFEWLPADCADLLQDKTTPGPVAVSGLQTLPADTLFAFARSGRDDILPDGRAALDALAAQVEQAGDVQVVVIGHTDRVGDELANQRLSEQRAATVREYLIAQGIAEDAITSAGRGEREPVKDCDAGARSAEIACLAPNRRVEIMVKVR